MPEDKVETATTTEETSESAAEAASQETDDNVGWKDKSAKARFDEINQRMKTAETKAQEEREARIAAEARLQALESARPKEEPKPPAGMTEEEQIRWTIKSAVEQELGMSLKDAKTALSSLPETSKTAQRARWDALCRDAGIDPNSKQVQRYAKGLAAEEGQTLESIVKECSDIFGKKAAKEERKPPNSMELGTETPVMIDENDLPFDKREAVKAAREGRRAPHVDASELLERRGRVKGRGAARA